MWHSNGHYESRYSVLIHVAHIVARASSNSIAKEIPMYHYNTLGTIEQTHAVTTMQLSNHNNFIFYFHKNIYI